MSVFAQYADVLAVAQPDLHALLNPHTGFAPRIAQICRQRLEDAQDASSPQEIELAKLELNTWMLLQALMAARKTAVPQSTFCPNPYTPTSTLAQAILRASPLLTELVIVREWLHDTATQPPIPEATTGYWSFTKHMLVQNQRMPTAPTAGVVDALDPDATTKSGGGHLASSDAVRCPHTSRLSLTHTDRATTGAFFSHYMRIYAPDGSKKPSNYRDAPANRGEQLAYAACSCLDGTLSVGLFFCMFMTQADLYYLATDPTDFMDDDDDGMDNQVWSGNRHRKLWKSTCTRAALNVRVLNCLYSPF